MTVQELINRLEDEDPDAELRFGYQESWPLQSTVCGVVAGADLVDDLDDLPDENDVSDGRERYVYIVEGVQDRDQPYAPRGIFDAAF